MNKLLFLLCLALVATPAHARGKQQAAISSPGKTTRFELCFSGQGRLCYRVHYQNRTVIDTSGLGLTVNNVALDEHAVPDAVTTTSHREKFYWPLGEDDTLVNNYNELRATFHTGDRRFTVIARAYDGSIALRYEVSSDGESTIGAEHTSFHFTAPCTIYQYNQESVFTPTPLDSLETTCDLPATLTSRGMYISIGEADNTGYTKAELQKGAAGNSLAVVFPRDKAVAFKGRYLSPWRTISIARSAIGLHPYSQLYLKLASLPENRVPSWIKPGKLIRAQLNTQSGLDCIDFAAAHHMQYIMFDAGWYGAEFRSSSDPTQVIADIDMPRVIAYGKEKGIGVILYVNYVGLKAKLDTILPLYKNWGVAGLKFGFVDGLTQQGLNWLVNAMQKVYDHGFILDIHDNYKPTGLSRRFPNLLTQEGIRGDENSPDAFHNTVLPYTRFLAGPADFTFCYPNAFNSYSKNVKVSKAQQLALTVIYFSPLQSLFWYGKPGEYTNESEIEFFRYVPTVWNESHYLAGEIGKNISVARRHGHTWFMGNAAGPEDWNGSVVLSFLKAGKQYTATVFEDDSKGSIRKRTLQVRKNDRFSFAIPARCGQAVMIE
jgi:alpha-glucosidase